MVAPAPRGPELPRPPPSTFVSTLQVGYSVVLGPITGILVADYYFLRRCQLDLDALYSADPSAPYFYAGGVNPAALVALAAGAAPTLPGLAQQLYGASVPPLFKALYSGA